MSQPEKDQMDYDGFNKYLKLHNASWSDFFRQLLQKPAYLLIVVSNLAIFLLPNLNLQNNAITFLWIYMVQSLLIGLVHFFKLNFYKFSPANGRLEWKNPHAISLFFLVHYGFFHFVYFFFLPPKNVDWFVVLEGASIFMFALLVNTIRHFSKENSGTYSATDFMFLPYVRIIPIHIAIILGGFLSVFTGGFTGVFVLLAVFKTGLELFLEYLQHLGISFSALSKISNGNGST